MATREQLTRDARMRGLTGREASAWVNYQLAKERLSNAQEERRAKAAAQKAAPPRGSSKGKPTAKKSAPKAPASGFSLFRRRG